MPLFKSIDTVDSKQSGANDQVGTTENLIIAGSDGVVHPEIIKCGSFSLGC